MKKSLSKITLKSDEKGKAFFQNTKYGLTGHLPNMRSIKSRLWY